MSDVRNVNDLIVQGRVLVDSPAKAHITIGEWIDYCQELKAQLKTAEKPIVAGMLATLYGRLNEDLAA